MRCVDVNILINAHRPESARHDEFRAWLDEARNGPEPLGLIPLVAGGFLRTVTNHRVYRDPTPLPVALAFVDALREAPATGAVIPGARHWSIFADLCLRVDAKANVVPDAFLAAIALEQGATWVTADRGFSRFPGLRWVHPLGDS